MPDRPPESVDLNKLLEQSPDAVPAIVHPEAGIAFANPNADGSIPAGYEQESPTNAAQDMVEAARAERFAGPAHALGAATEGGFSALTFGGSDWLLKALGTDVAERAEARPGWRAAGEIGTGIATAVLTGGLGAAGELGAAGNLLSKVTPLGAVTARTGKLAEAIGGIKGLSVAGGIEGLAQAGGGIVSKLAIKDEEFTAKAALLDLGFGAIFGAAGGGAAGILGMGAAGARKLAPKTSLDLGSAEAVAFDDAVKGATKIFKEADKHLGKTAKVSRIGDLPDQYLADGYTARNIIQFVDDVAEGNLDQAAAVGRGAREVAAVRKARQKLDGLIEPVGEGAGTGATKGRSNLYGPENAYQTTTDVPALREAMQEYHDATVALGRRVGLDDSAEKILNGATGKGGLQRAFDEVSSTVPEAEVAALNAARKSFEEGGEYTLKSLSKLNHGQLIEKLGRMDAYHTEFQKVAEKLAVPGMADSLEAMSKQATAQLEIMTGLSARDIDQGYTQLLRNFEVEAPAFKGPAADLHRAWIVNQAMKSGGEFRDLLYKAAREAEELADNQAVLLGDAKPDLSRTKRVLRGGARRGAGFAGYMAGSAVGGPIMGSVVAGAVSQAVSDAMRGAGYLAGATGKLLNGVAGAADLAAKAARHSSATVGTIVRQTSFGSDEQEPPKNETARQTFERLGKEVTDLVVDPQTPMRVNEALAGIRDVSWGVGDKMEGMALAGVEYLSEKYPKDPGVLQRWGMSTWKPTDAQVTDWLNRVAATVNPLNSIKRFMSGGGSPAEAETIRQVHPELFREFQMAFMENLPAVKDKIPGATRVRLGILFNAPIDSRLRPEFRQFMREDWVARAEAQKPIDVNAGMTPEQPTPAQKLLG